MPSSRLGLGQYVYRDASLAVFGESPYCKVSVFVTEGERVCTMSHLYMSGPWNRYSCACHLGLRSTPQSLTAHSMYF